MEQDAHHVIARSACGDLYLWGEKTGASLSISTVGALAFPKFRTKSPLDRHLQMFFSACNREENDFADCFAAALQTFGRLKADEMYGFVPTLALGGSSDFENVQKVKATEHLLILAQLSELELMNRREP